MLLISTTKFENVAFVPEQIPPGAAPLRVYYRSTGGLVTQATLRRYNSWIAVGLNVRLYFRYRLSIYGL